jgi:sterol 24-C-methyltransferase
MTVIMNLLKCCGLMYVLSNSPYPKRIVDGFRVIRNLYNVTSAELEDNTSSRVLMADILPQMHADHSLYHNQLATERLIASQLGDDDLGSKSRLLHIGGGFRHLAELTGNVTERLDLKHGTQHLPFEYADNAFGGAYAVQSVWKFFETRDLISVSREIYRVLKPGAIFACSEFMFTPEFNWDNPEHAELHRLFRPTLSAKRFKYSRDVVFALRRAGFEVIRSSPSVAPAWPIVAQKINTFRAIRVSVRVLTKVSLMPATAATFIYNLVLGGDALVKAEKMKIVDLNWQFVVQKPNKSLWWRYHFF